MKRLLIIPLMLFSASLLACCNGDNETADEPNVPTEQPSGESSDTAEDNSTDQTSLSMKITVGNRTVTATMEDNAAAKDLLSRLPLEITLEDFNNTAEKIFYPAPALNTEGVKVGCAPAPGDIAIYTPWRNVAFFCKGGAHSNDLVKIGHIDGNGIEPLQVAGDVKVKLEK